MTQDELLQLIDQAAAEGWMELDLADQGLTELPPEIGRLTQLETLILGKYRQDEGWSSNRLTELPAEIGELKNLKTLEIAGNPLIGKASNALPDELFQLTNLQILNLSNTQLSMLPEEFSQLTNLQSLDLSNNQLNSLPERIAQLTNLKSLSLSFNQLNTLPEAIIHLSNLQSFDLSSNQLSSLPEWISQLTNLQRLFLLWNHLSSLPEWIAQLTNLKTLILDHNQLSSLPEWIAQLNNLQILHLSSNQLSSLPESISQLTSLRFFHLSSNQLSSLPESISQLTNLLGLALNNNQLNSLPEWVTQLPNLKKLDLRGNPISIPVELLWDSSTQEPGDLQGIFDYYFQTLDPNETEPLYEAKFIIVGEGGAGKTTLAKKLLDPDYKLDSDEKSTEGIDVLRWEFDHPNGTRFRANIWDFGGQEIYHATHQFFLTKRSLYALVVDTREDNTDLSYWLNVVDLLSESSPVFIIKNEKQNRQCEVNERQLKGEFVDSLEKVLATNLGDNRGLDDLKTAIQQRIVQLPHVGHPLPKVWVRVRAALENYAATRNTLTVEEYCAICRTCQLTDKARMQSLSRYLHDLGVILHFHDDPVLKHTVILKPEWGTAAVYKALDTEEVRSNFGRFTRAQLDDIWRDGEYADLRDELLQLMMRFKLCYQIPGTANQYIAPQLLEIEKPDYSWDDGQNLFLRYRYEFMPKGILTRFIVEMHRFIEAQTLVWKSGVVLTNGAARAEVIELYHRGEIQIRVSGIRQKDLITVIDHEFEKIHSTYDRLRYQTLIPCNCSTCSRSQDPHFYSLEALRQRIANRKQTVECAQSPYEDVQVRTLIDDITDRSAELLLGEKEFELSQTPFKSSDRIKATWATQTLPADQQQRMALFETLSALPGPQFEQLIFMLNAPHGNVGNTSAPQGDRVPKLLEWAKSNLSGGLEAVETAIATLKQAP